jgi:hypothetical protein
MGINFPTSPLVGDLWPNPAVPGQGQYTWDGEKWTSGTVNTVGAVRYDTPQNLTEAQDAQARSNIYAAPFDALAYSGMQINGSMEVSQELGTTGVANNGYIIDGWRIDTTAGIGINAAQFTGLLGAVYPFSCALICQVTTPKASLVAGDTVMIRQFIEGYRVARLGFGTARAQSITIGFWTGHARTGIYSGSLRNNSADRSCVFTYTQNAVGVLEYKTVTIPGDTTGTWLYTNGVGLQLTFSLASGGTYSTGTTGAWQAGNFIASTTQVNSVAAVSDVFRITGVVVLPGIEAPTAAQSPLIMRPYDQELVTCKRYYNTSYDGVVPGTASANSYISMSATTSAGLASTITFPVPMRASPSVSIWSYSGTLGQWSTTAGANAGAGAVSSTRWGLINGTGTGLTVGTKYVCQYVADARL